MDVERLRVTATAATPPATGPWFVACTGCGPLSVAEDGHDADRAITAHMELHRADIMTGPAS